MWVIRIRVGIKDVIMCFKFMKYLPVCLKDNVVSKTGNFMFLKTFHVQPTTIKNVRF